jgi:hypothetical protein
MRRLRLGLGTGVVASNQPASVVRTVPIPIGAAIPTVVRPTPVPTVARPTSVRGDVTHAGRTMVGPDA